MSKQQFSIVHDLNISLTNGAYISLIDLTEYKGCLHEFYLIVSNNDCDIKIVADSENVVLDFGLKDYSIFAAAKNEVSKLNCFRIIDSGKEFHFAPQGGLKFSNLKIQVKANKSNITANFIGIYVQ